MAAQRSQLIDLKALFSLVIGAIAGCNPLCENCQADDAEVRTHCDAEVGLLYPIDQPGAWWQHRLCDIEASQARCSDKLVDIRQGPQPLPGRAQVQAVPVVSDKDSGYVIRWQEVTADGEIRRHLDETYNGLGERSVVTWYCPHELRLPADEAACKASHWVDEVVNLKISSVDTPLEDCERAVDADTCTVIDPLPGCTFDRQEVARAWRIEDDNASLTLPGWGSFDNVVVYSIEESSGGEAYRSTFWWARGVGKLLERDGQENTLEILVDGCLPGSEDCTGRGVPSEADLVAACDSDTLCDTFMIATLD